MTNEEIVIVKKTWRVMRDFNPVVIGDSFYTKLFSQKPSLRKMFSGSMEEHYKTLVDTMNMIIARLDQPVQLVGELEVMARRHLYYEVSSSHYKLVGEAMLWTIERALGKDCNKQILNAWKNCYVSVIEKTIAASKTLVK